VNLNRPPLFCQFSVSFPFAAANEEPDTCSLVRGNSCTGLHWGGLRGRKSLQRTGKRGKLGPDLNLIPSLLSSGKKARWRAGEFPTPRHRGSPGELGQSSPDPSFEGETRWETQIRWLFSRLLLVFSLFPDLVTSQVARNTRNSPRRVARSCSWRWAGSVSNHGHHRLLQA
jgi:hypothetical protein